MLTWQIAKADGRVQDAEAGLYGMLADKLGVTPTRAGSCARSSASSERIDAREQCSRAAGFDFVVIGSGPAGEGAAMRPPRDGASVAVIERARAT